MSSPQAFLDPPLVRADRPAVAFPGQGVDVVALREQLRNHAAHPLITSLRERFEVSDWATVDFGDTGISQPCTFVTGYVSATSVLDPRDVPLVLGHSLGEITALAFARSLTAEDALSLVMRRGAVCHEVQQQRPGQMVAVMGLDATGVEWVRRRAIGVTGGILEAAGFNGKTQTVLSGDVATVQAAIACIGEAEGLAQVLPIGGAFHSPLMLDAVDRFASAVRSTVFRDPLVPLLSTVDARVHTASADLPDLVIRALLLPVRWMDATSAARSLGVEVAWDAGPGTTLQKLCRRDRSLTFVRDPQVAREEVR